MDANTPEGTGELSIDEAVSRLTTPTPSEDSEQAAPEPEEAASVKDDADEADPETHDEPEADAEDDAAEDEGADDADPEEDAEGDDEEPGQTKTYKVRVDGEEIEVTEDELLRGYSRQSDYTKRTQKLAEERKAFEQQAAEVQALRQQYAQQLEAMMQATPQEREPDWDRLFNEDPLEYAVQRERWRQSQEQRQRMMQEHQRVQAEQQREIEAKSRETLQSEAQRLVEAVPEWKDKERAAKDVKAIKSFAAGAYGLGEDELAGIADHRAILILRDAMKFQQAQKGKAKATEKVARKPDVTMKPGTRPGKGTEKQRRTAARRQQLKRSGSLDDAAALLLGR